MTLKGDKWWPLGEWPEASYPNINKQLPLGEWPEASHPSINIQWPLGEWPKAYFLIDNKECHCERGPRLFIGADSYWIVTHACHGCRQSLDTNTALVHTVTGE